MSKDDDWDGLLELIGGGDDDLDDYLKLGDDAILLELDSDAVLNSIEAKDLTPDIVELHKKLFGINQFELFRISNQIASFLWDLVSKASIELVTTPEELVNEINKNVFLIPYQRDFFISVVERKDFSPEIVANWLEAQVLQELSVSQFFWDLAEELVKTRHLEQDEMKRKMAARKIIFVEGYFIAILRSKPTDTTDDKTIIKPKAWSSRPRRLS
jgi:hypothetical protein